MKNLKLNKIARSRQLRSLANEIDPLEVEKELREGKKGKTYEIDGEPFELGDDVVGAEDDEFVFDDTKE